MDQGIRAWWAEFLGTFTLCFIGQGAICVHQLSATPDTGLLSIAIAHGLALAVMISAFGAISGGHLNPAVTISFLVSGRQSLPSAIAYWISQLLGAIVASIALVALFPDPVWKAVSLGAPAVGAGLTPVGAMLAEFILTFFLVTVVWGTAVDERRPNIGGFGIGLAVTMGILVGGPLTGAALNPARAFGPALISGFWSYHWVYWIAPLLAGAAAGFIYHNFLIRRAAVAEARA